MAGTDRTIPRAPLLLGTAGLLPFWGLAMGIGLAPLGGASAPSFATALATYGAVIVSFLGGIRWGLATRADQPAVAAQYVLAVVPSLLAWAALALPPVWSLAGLGLVALVLGPLDTRLVGTLAPAWYGRLRLILSCGAGAALLLGAALLGERA